MAIIEVWKFKILSDHYINQKTITRGQIKNQAETWFKTLLIERLTESFISEKGWIFYQSLKKLVFYLQSAIAIIQVRSQSRRETYDRNFKKIIQRNLVFVTKSDFLIPIFFPPDGVNLDFFI